ncbi:Phosphatidylcholine-sterol acyltransferase (Lecithin-cholesterol acyltransferase)/ Phospholipase A [Fasciolopsis buskii]|uniref:Phosphatidylcholine-sterol acyltransferase (Lecithin-cholesterol acyltransferase)/ Phospholipase A n=1 Tax=Fasciolopsis buskii TaxID=27845 RepID=A0A8E0RY62_9TREM|nr:Phosphatidylcholine-sterol acyltransferase (Lecithin-cholesterol acyltransferase)/ Phospholipase A [Fasciolopsis buski]
MLGGSGHAFVVAILLTSVIKSALEAVIKETTKPLKNPVILIPGDGGNRIYARLRESPANQSSELIWLNLKDFIDTDTITRVLSLHYDDQFRSHDAKEYEITFPGWGDTETVSTLDSHQKIFGRYFDGIIDDLKLDPYFVSNRSIRGAPYDFRRAPNENGQFFQRLKALIEETYSINNNQRVVLVGHSMGCLMSMLFMEKQSLEWKKQYVKSFVSLAGPYGGAAKVLRVVASGENFHVFFRSPLVFRDLQRTFASFYFMVPDPRLWSANEILVETPKRNYTSRDYKQFFEDIGFPIGQNLMEKSVKGVDFFNGPTGVDEVYCLYGTSLPTDHKMVYSPPSILRRPFPNQVPTVMYGNGDGTVNIRSLEVCKMWSNVTVIPLPLARHLEIMRDARVLKLMRKLTGFEEVH